LPEVPSRQLSSPNLLVTDASQVQVRGLALSLDHDRDRGRGDHTDPGRDDRSSPAVRERSLHVSTTHVSVCSKATTVDGNCKHFYIKG
jgi:hypothetical protein